MISTELARELFDYNPDTGMLSWKIARSNVVKIGQIIKGFASDKRRRYARVDGKMYAVHQLIWIWHGRDLSGEVDHRNGDNTDNRIDNLRIATSSQNKYNIGVRSDNKLGIKGVSYIKRLNKYHVQVMANKKKVVNLYIDDIELAELVAIEARDKYHGAFARHA